MGRQAFLQRLGVLEAVVVAEEGGTGLGFFTGDVGGEFPIEIGGFGVAGGLLDEHDHAIDFAQLASHGEWDGLEVGSEEVELLVGFSRGVQEEHVPDHDPVGGVLECHHVRSLTR